MDSRKSQGMPLNVVIIAALVLIVLIVLVVILTGRTSKFSESTKQVEEKYSPEKCDIPGTGRKCYPYGEGCPTGTTYVGVMDCDDKICCQ